MQRGRWNWSGLAPSKSRGPGLTKDCLLCLNCERRFPNRMCLEEHPCPSASYICSCGSEFSFYKDMQEHSSTHEPGRQAIRQRLFEKHGEQEQEQQLSRPAPAGKGKWSASRLDSVAASSFKAQVSKKSALMSQASLPPKPNPTSTKPTTNLPGSAAPTVDLWPLYQPVVLMESKCGKRRPYSCVKCGQSFTTKSSLTLHHNTHATDKVFGCLGCGLLLSSKKYVPRYHLCNSPSSSLKVRLITAKPKNYKIPNEANRPKSLIPYTSHIKGQQPHVTLSRELQLKTPTYSEPHVGKRPTQVTAATKVFKCRVCQISFETLNQLQRHKCAKAQEFVKQQALSGQPLNRPKNKMIVKMQYPQMNGVPASSNVKTNQDRAFGLGRGLGGCPVNGKGEMDLEDDCYIVESSSAKPAQTMYQLTSSRPVITT